MKFSPVILALRTYNGHFGANVGGALDFMRAEKNSLVNDTAFVLPLGEDCSKNDSDNSINQTITDKFGVICAMKADRESQDQSGLLVYDLLDDVRNELLAVLINFDLGYDSTVEYAGAKLLDMNNGWIWWQYEFVIQEKIVAGPDGQGFIEQQEVEERQQPSQLPDLYKIYADFILSPSAQFPYNGRLPASEFIPVDLSTQVTQDDDPNPGAFETSFAGAFRTLLHNIIRRS
jgi:hypothetical protein